MVTSTARWMVLASIIGVTGCAQSSMSRESVWVCRRPDCGEADMVRSGRDEWMDDTKVHLITVRGRLAVNFDLDPEHAIAKAAISDCQGHSVAIPADQIKAPGTHGVEDGAGWAVFVFPPEMSTLDQACGLMVLSVEERLDDHSWNHSFTLSHHPKIGWVSEDQLRDDDDLWPPR